MTLSMVREMDKRKCIEEFMRYGGNELFSTLMHQDIQRSECIDKLVQLLQSYSDYCYRIKGRSAAYRFMLGNAAKRGWLIRESYDLNRYKLTVKEKEYIVKKLEEYIASGGSKSRVLKKDLLIAPVVLAVGLFVFCIWKYMKSDVFSKRMMDYYEKQIIIENNSHSSEAISFNISTSDSIAELRIEDVPKVYYVTSDIETEVAVILEGDMIYSHDETEIKLIKDGNDGFQKGTYKINFVFYSYNGDGEIVNLPTITREVIVR